MRSKLTPSWLHRLRRCRLESAPDPAPWPTPERRLRVALAVSIALHAGAVLLPYLGARPPLAQARQTPWPRHLFTASMSIAKPADTTATPPARPDRPPPAHLAAAIAPPAQPAPDQTLGRNLLPIPAPSYYTTDQLTKRPQPAVLAELETPETRPLVASGLLVLKLWIDDEGRVADVAVEKSDLPEVFSRTAIDSFKHSRFLPGERNGQRVGSVMRIEVSYEDRRAAARR